MDRRVIMEGAGVVAAEKAGLDVGHGGGRAWRVAFVGVRGKRLGLGCVMGCRTLSSLTLPSFLAGCSIVVTICGVYMGILLCTDDSDRVLPISLYVDGAKAIQNARLVSVVCGVSTVNVAGTRLPMAECKREKIRRLWLRKFFRIRV